MLIKVTQCRKPARGLPQQWQAPAEPRGWQKSHAQRAPGRQPHADQAPRLWKGLREATPAEARAPRAVGAASWGWPRTAWFLGAAQPSEPGGPLWLAVEVAARCSRNAPRSAECSQHSLFSLNTGLAVRPLHTHTPPAGDPPQPGPSAVRRAGQTERGPGRAAASGRRGHPTTQAERSAHFLPGNLLADAAGREAPEDASARDPASEGAGRTTGWTRGQSIYPAAEARPRAGHDTPSARAKP